MFRSSSASLISSAMPGPRSRVTRSSGVPLLVWPFELGSGMVVPPGFVGSGGDSGSEDDVMQFEVSGDDSGSEDDVMQIASLQGGMAAFSSSGIMRYNRDALRATTGALGLPIPSS